MINENENQPQRVERETIEEPETREDFHVSKFWFYKGPNYYLDRRSVVFNLWIDPTGPRVEHYSDAVVGKFPVLTDKLPGTVVDLFALALIQVFKLDIDLYLNEYSIGLDGDEYTIAVEFLDDQITRNCVAFTQQWFRAMTTGTAFDFDKGFHKLHMQWDKTLYGGPTLYSLIEAGMKRGIDVHYLWEENQFQWGYGKKQIRGRSTTFSVDGIKDTEFTMYKDMVADFLMMFGFPTPKGSTCFNREETVAEAVQIGFPVVVKPVAGHKGQGVTTGIRDENGVLKAYDVIMKAVEEEGASFDGVIVQQQIEGFDHRLLAVGGKFIAALERVPAYVEGNGEDTIETLINHENATINRLDNPRSPLCKIRVDDDLKDYLGLQNLTTDSVPEANERIYLRRVANISAGGVSINVTDRIHPKNVKLVEDIAKYFNVTCLGIDVLTKDISVPWTEGNFGIIEINAGPGVFMHLAPALGGSIDVPGKIMEYHFPFPGYDRIPIIAGNKLSLNFCHLLYDKLREIKPDIVFESLTGEGVYMNREYFFKENTHDTRVKIIMRNPRLDFAAFNHNKDDIFDYGTYHYGADIVILEEPHYAEEILARDLLPHGHLVIVDAEAVHVFQDDVEIGSLPYDNPIAKDGVILKAIEPLLENLVHKYDIKKHHQVPWTYAKF